MPFKSDKQRKFLYSQLPEVAKHFAEKEKEEKAKKKAKKKTVVKKKVKKKD